MTSRVFHIVNRSFHFVADVLQPAFVSVSLANPTVALSNYAQHTYTSQQFVFQHTVAVETNKYSWRFWYQSPSFKVPQGVYLIIICRVLYMFLWRATNAGKQLWCHSIRYTPKCTWRPRVDFRNRVLKNVYPILFIQNCLFNSNLKRSSLSSVRFKPRTRVQPYCVQPVAIHQKRSIWKWYQWSIKDPRYHGDWCMVVIWQ